MRPVPEKKRGGTRGYQRNHVQSVANTLFAIDKEKQEKLQQQLIIASKTENWSSILDIIRGHLKVVGMQNIIPSVRLS